MHIRRSRRIAAAALVLPPLALFAPGEVRACVCVADVPLSKHVADATAIFEGVVREQGVDATRNWGLARFEVTRRWKGEVASSQTLRFGRFTDCHSGFATGGRYVIFAHTQDGALVDDSGCGAGGPGAPPPALLAELGAGMAPLAEAGPQEVIVDPTAPLSGGCQLSPAGAPGALGPGMVALLLAGLVGQLSRSRVKRQ